MAHSFNTLKTINGKRPKTKRGERFLLNREPKVVENVKSAMFVKGPKTSEVVNKVLHDLFMLKKPDAVMLKKHNRKRPFEDESEVNFLSEKNDCSLFAFGTHSKKRPHNLIIGRCFDNQVMDMVELGITDFTPIISFAVNSNAMALGSKPCFIFRGTDFEYREEYRKFANIILDFFSGAIVTQINLEGLDHVIICTALDGKIYFRHYAIELRRVQASTLPRVVLEEMGPSLDLVIKRTKFASKEMMKSSHRIPREIKPKKVKNVTTTAFAKLGTMHKEKQDLNTMQTRKVKGLKRKRSEKKTTGGEAIGAFAASVEGKTRKAAAGGAAETQRPDQQPAVATGEAEKKKTNAKSPAKKAKV